MPSDFATLIGKRLGKDKNGAGGPAGPMLNPSDGDDYGGAPAVDGDKKDADAMELSAAQDIIDAHGAKDPKALQAALKDFIEICLDQQDYGEAETDKDEPQEGT